MRSFQPALSGSKHHQQASHTTLMKPATPQKPLATLLMAKQWPLFQPVMELFCLIAISTE